MKYDNIIKFLKAYPEIRELQFIEASGGENRYRSFNLLNKFVLQFPEESGVGTMVLTSMVDIYKVSQLEYYKNLAQELGTENAQGFYDSITYSSCKKDKAGKIMLNVTSGKWMKKMLDFIVKNYVQLKYNGKSSPRRNSKQYKDKLSWSPSPNIDRVTKRGEPKDFQEIFDSITDMYMTIIGKDKTSMFLDKADKKFLLYQIESCLTKLHKTGGV